MAEDIEKFDENVFIDKEGDILGPDDAGTKLGIDPNAMRSSHERANLMHSRDLGPTEEDIQTADMLFEQTKARPEPTPGVSTLFRAYVRDLHTAMDYASAHAKATAQHNALTSENDNAFKHRSGAADIASISAKRSEYIRPDYHRAISHLAQTAELLQAGFVMGDLIDARATVEGIQEDFMTEYGPGNAPKRGRWYKIDKMEKALGVDPRRKNKINRKPKQAVISKPTVATVVQEDEPLMTVEEEERLSTSVTQGPLLEQDRLDTSSLSAAALKHVEIIKEAINVANAHNQRIDIRGAKSVVEYLATDAGSDKSMTSDDYRQLLKVYGIGIE